NVAKGSGTDIRLTPADLGDVTDNCLQEGGTCSVDLAHGWKLQLEDPGEKSLASPLTIAGNVFFTTYIPSTEADGASPCLPAEGAGRLYAVDLKTAASVVNYDVSDDDPNYVGEPTTKNDRSTELVAPGIPAQVVLVPPNKILRPDLQVDDLSFTTRWRSFWYIQEDAL
ncbi:MAG: hypothetical protein JXB36_12735, partial [Gammaproteobacteria bacterium]|nr:hypothetical protein [Gammaproteobacteria bacterium]